MTNPSDAAAPVGLRERKKHATRHALAETALEFALERGWHGFTVADVTEAVGVSRRTFSNYFAGKADCVVAVSDAWLDEVLDTVRDAPAGEPLDEVLQTALVQVSVDAPDRWERYIRVVKSEPELETVANGMDSTLVARVAEVIAGRLSSCSKASAADVDDETDPRVELLAMFCVNAGRLCLQRWLAQPPPRTSETLAAALRSAFSLIDLHAFGR